MFENKKHENVKQFYFLLAFPKKITVCSKVYAQRSIRLNYVSKIQKLVSNTILNLQFFNINMSILYGGLLQKSKLNRTTSAFILNTCTEEVTVNLNQKKHLGHVSVRCLKGIQQNWHDRLIFTLICLDYKSNEMKRIQSYLPDKEI